MVYGRAVEVCSGEVMRGKVSHVMLRCGLAVMVSYGRVLFGEARVVRLELAVRARIGNVRSV